jgi:Glycosyltransferase WbsX
MPIVEGSTCGQKKMGLTVVDKDAAFPKAWSEWDLLAGAAPRFPEHRQPLRPLWYREDESVPAVFAKKIETALQHGIDYFTFAFYWSRGKQLLQGALERGFLPSVAGTPFRSALMWANRMPRRVMPVKDPQAALIDPQRLVYLAGNGTGSRQTAPTGTWCDGA